MHRTVHIVRHGATHLNHDDVSVDRIRAHKDVPLSADGRAEAHRLAGEMAKNKPDVIVTSDLCRASETAKIICDKLGMKIADETRDLRPWHVGKLTGEKTEKALPILLEYLHKKPSEAVPGGESFYQFRDRFLKGLHDILAKHKGTIAIVAHHRNERLLHAAKAAGFSADGAIDKHVFGQKGHPTAHVTVMDIPVEWLKAVAGHHTLPKQDRTGVQKWGKDDDGIVAATG